MVWVATQDVQWTARFSLWGVFFNSGGVDGLAEEALLLFILLLLLLLFLFLLFLLLSFSFFVWGGYIDDLLRCFADSLAARWHLSLGWWQGGSSCGRSLCSRGLAAIHSRNAEQFDCYDDVRHRS